MKRLLRRATTVAALATVGALLAPATGALAGPDALTPCDNIDAQSSTIADVPIVLPGDLGTITVHLASSQDSYVRYNGPGSTLDTLVGVDLQTISLDEDLAGCLRIPVAGNYFVIVNVVDLRIQLCQYSGEPGPGVSPACTTID